MQSRFRGVICILVVALLHQETSAERSATSMKSPSCVDEEGRQVDWYIAYKFPELSEEGAPFNSGHAYAYITSGNEIKGRHQPASQRLTSSILHRIKSLLGTTGHERPTSLYETSSNYSKSRQSEDSAENRQWVLSSKLISDQDSIVMRTLAIAYGEQSDKINSILYNDQPPEESGRSRGRWGSKAHAKGVVLMDDITGSSIWLTHSTPRFPPLRSRPLEFFENSRRFGQTFMCIRFDLRETGLPIVNHLLNMDPQVYDMQISQRLYSIIPELRDLSGSRRRTGRSSGRTDKLAQQIKTQAGQDLRLYSKSADFGEDLYSGWIDSELKTTLYVETWRNGAGTPLNSSCPRDNYQVNNVKDLKVYDEGKKVSWSYRLDHSKWAISDDGESAIVCISDINRMQSQFKRGGGAVCIKCPSCWSVFSNTILDLEPCPYKKVKTVESN